jgi:hypothetical protein
MRTRQSLPDPMAFSEFVIEVLRMLARNRITVILSLVVICGLIAWINSCGGGASSSIAGGGGGGSTPTPAPTPTPAAHFVAVSWQASTSPNVAFYNVYRSATSGGPYTRVGWRVSGLTYTDTAVQAGATYFYVVTSVTSSNVESVTSSQITATVPTN